MTRSESSVEVLENCLVSPPSGFIPPQASLALTFFDIPWLILHPVQRLFFYSYQGSHYHFTTDLPNIKHSLSLTLQHFYPLSGTLTWPSQSIKPQIHIQDNSGVMLTVAEANLDFNDLVGNHPRGVNQFHPLVPQLKTSQNAQGEKEVPAMALQVTLFPNTGICVGITMLHAVADGKTTSHFMKSWASVCKSGSGDTSCLLPNSLPCYDRNLIIDPKNLETIYLNQLATLHISHSFFYLEKNLTNEMDKVRATFVLGRPEIQKLKSWVLVRLDDMCCEKDVGTRPQHLSSFVLMFACVWVCLLKALTSDEDVDRMETEHLTIPVDCRERLNPPLPTTYFGNCLMACFVDVKRNELVGENGIAIASKAIGNAIQKFISEGVLKEAEHTFAKFGVLARKWFPTIAGSPKLFLYDTDFGWGRPKKVEVISIDTTTGSMSLSECRDEEGGLEIGVVLGKLQMDAFTSLFTSTLGSLS